MAGILVGSVAVGHISDRFGRRLSIFLSIAMLVSTNKLTTIKRFREIMLGPLLFTIVVTYLGKKASAYTKFPAGNEKIFLSTG